MCTCPQTGFFICCGVCVCVCVCGGGGGGGGGMNDCKVSLNLELQVLLQRNLQVVMVEDNNCLVK